MSGALVGNLVTTESKQYQKNQLLLQWLSSQARPYASMQAKHEAVLLQCSLRNGGVELIFCPLGLYFSH